MPGLSCDLGQLGDSWPIQRGQTRGQALASGTVEPVPSRQHMRLLGRVDDRLPVLSQFVPHKLILPRPCRRCGSKINESAGAPIDDPGRQAPSRTLRLMLPFRTALQHSTGGVLKAAPEDFVVEEIPLYPRRERVTFCSWRSRSGTFRRRNWCDACRARWPCPGSISAWLA